MLGRYIVNNSANVLTLYLTNDIFNYTGLYSRFNDMTHRTN